jgi:hypothetical protein
LQALGLESGATRRSLATPLDVVRHHLAMQAQDWGASRWAVGSRLEDASNEQVIAAYDAGELVRTWPMRGTVHVLAAADAPWLIQLAGERALSGIEHLAGGQSMSRSELTRLLEGCGLMMGGGITYHTVWYLAQTGTIVQGPTRDGEQLLVLTNEWITNPVEMPDRDAALATLARRYLAAHAPASVDDLTHWTKLTKTDCKRAFALIAADLVTIEHPSGATLYALAEVFERDFQLATEHGPPSTCALAAFDEHLLGYRDRDDVLDPQHATLVDPGRNGVFRWTIIDRGRVIATWRRTKRANSIRVDVQHFVPRPTRALRDRTERALAAFGAFHATKLDIRHEPMSAGNKTSR